MTSILVESHSDEAIAEMKEKLSRAGFVVGALMEGYAKDNTPVDTGRLRNSITHAETEDAIYVGTNVEYAPYVEEGARNRTAHHMLRDSVANHIEEYRGIIEESLRED